MHECPNCGQACDCDNDDLWHDWPFTNDCIHRCDDEEDDLYLNDTAWANDDEEAPMETPPKSVDDVPYGMLLLTCEICHEMKPETAFTDDPDYADCPICTTCHVMNIALLLGEPDRTRGEPHADA